MALTRVIEWKEASSVIEMEVFGKKIEAEVMLPGATTYITLWRQQR